MTFPSLKWIAASAVFTGILSSGAFASIVTLSFTTDPVAQKYNVYATVSSDSHGLSSFYLDVVGSNGVTVTSSTEKAPKVYNPALDGGAGDFEGFSEFDSNGTAGVGITAGQNIIAADLSYLLLDSAAGVGTPLLIATGSYSGSSGTLTANVHPGGFFDTFPLTFTAGSNAVAATVVPGVATIAAPEPASLGLMVLGVAGAVRLRKRAR